MNDVMIWLVSLVVLVLIEGVTLGLTTVWFAGGALIAMIFAAFDAPFYLQFIVFLAVSLILLFFTRPIAMKYFNKNRWKSNSEAIIGKTAVVTAEIDNLQVRGQVVVDGMEWTARSSSDDSIIPKDSTVKVVAIQGVKLIVEPEQQKNED